MQNEYLKIPASLFRPGERVRLESSSGSLNVTVEIVTWRGHESRYAYRVADDSSCNRVWVTEHLLKKLFEPCQPGQLEALLEGIWKPKGPYVQLYGRVRRP